MHGSGILFKEGFQIEQDIPEVVRDAYHRLVEQGFDKQLIKDNK